MVRLTRRSFLAISGAGLVVAACGDDDSGAGGAAASSSAPSDSDPEDLILGIQFPDGVASPPAFVAGSEQRAPFALANAEGYLGRDAPAQLELTVSPPSGPPETVILDRHTDGIPISYYPYVWTPEAPGTFEVSIGSSPGRQIRVADSSEVDLVQVGDDLRITETPTIDDPLGVDPLCTRPAGRCEFHQQSLTEIAEQPGPIALLLATPGFCQTEICGPVLDLLISEIADFDTVRAAHSEIYVAPTQAFEAGNTDPPELVGVVETYGLSYEPALIVADADHKVAGRLDFTWDRADLRSMLARVA